MLIITYNFAAVHILHQFHAQIPFQKFIFQSIGFIVGVLQSFLQCFSCQTIFGMTLLIKNICGGLQHLSTTIMDIWYNFGSWTLQHLIRPEFMDIIHFPMFSLYCNYTYNTLYFKHYYILYLYTLYLLIIILSLNYMKICFIIPILAILLFLSQSLLTKRMRKKSLSSFLQPKSISQSTACNFVSLDRAYNYSGVVRSGYLSVNKGNSVLAFIFYGKSDVVDPKLLSKYPTIIWLNGGPGSSSQTGNLQEMGPLLLKNFLVTKVVRNDFSWANEYNLLFVDQPVGTGLSYADIGYKGGAFVKSMDGKQQKYIEVAADFWFALNELYNSPSGCFHSNFLNIPDSSPLFLIGQSYAGKYVPSIGLKIIQKRKENNFLSGFKGIGIGDGFTAPYQILAQVGNFAFELSLLDYQERSQVQKMLINATHHHNLNNMDLLHDSFDNVLDYIVDTAGGINVYDITKDGDYDELLQPYFGSRSTIDLYNLNAQIQYDSQSDDVYDNLYSDFMKDETHRVEQLLRNNVSVLIYNGQDDLIVQNAGTMRWVQNLNYDNSLEFRDQLMSVWKTNGKISGSIKKAGKLQFRIVNRAGHLVPMDRPEQSLTMIKDWITKNNII